MEDNMIGKRFGKLTVLGVAEPYVAPSGGSHKRYHCVCECGNTTTVMKEHLMAGRQKSCGCLRKESRGVTHGEINTRLYRIWGNMCSRCSNPNNPAWHNYGGRGIYVCEEWKSYENFRDWARITGYNDSLTIDRRDNDRGYEPDNCWWVDDIKQANNKRNNHFVEYNGETKTIAEWAAALNVPYKALHSRIVRYGWSPDRAFNQPYRQSQFAKHNG